MLCNYCFHILHLKWFKITCSWLKWVDLSHAKELIHLGFISLEWRHQDCGSGSKMDITWQQTSYEGIFWCCIKQKWLPVRKLSLNVRSETTAACAHSDSFCQHMGDYHTAYHSQNEYIVFEMHWLYFFSIIIFCSLIFSDVKIILLYDNTNILNSLLPHTRLQ